MSQQHTGSLDCNRNNAIYTDEEAERMDALGRFPTTPSRQPRKRHDSDTTMIGYTPPHSDQPFSPTSPLNQDDKLKPVSQPSPTRPPHSKRPSFQDEVASNNPKYKSNDFKKHFVAMSGEFLGTFLFLWFALSGTSFAVTNETTNPVIQSYYASLVFGLALLANVWVFFRISGGLFNPAVTIGLVISGQLPWLRGFLFVPTQIIAGICASALVDAMFPGPLSGVTRLSSNTSVVQGLFIEVFLTALLTITVLFLAAEKHKTTFLAPVGIGLAFFSAELVGIPYTGGSLNPARSFGPDVATVDFPGYHWLYWVGPLLGAVLGAGYYRFAKWLDYEEANPGQDKTHPDEIV